MRNPAVLRSRIIVLGITVLLRIVAVVGIWISSWRLLLFYVVGHCAQILWLQLLVGWILSSQSGRLLEHGCAALCNLLMLEDNRTRFVEADGPKAVVGLLQITRNDTIMEHASRALSNFMTNRFARAWLAVIFSA